MPGEALTEFHRLAMASLELDKVGSRLGPVDVGGANVCTIQATVTDGAWGSGVLTVERSNDGEEWVAMATPLTISSDGISTTTPTTKYMRVRVSTAGSANDKVRVSLYARLN